MPCCCDEGFEVEGRPAPTSHCPSYSVALCQFLCLPASASVCLPLSLCLCLYLCLPVSHSCLSFSAYLSVSLYGLYIKLFLCLSSFFWPHPTTCGILVSLLGSNPWPQHWKHLVLTTGTTRYLSASFCLPWLPYPTPTTPSFLLVLPFC